MNAKVSERAFEDAIECALLAFGPDACAGDTSAVRETSPPYGESVPGGYRRRTPEEYDRKRCLLPRDVIDFVQATQPEEWKKLTGPGAGIDYKSKLQELTQSKYQSTPEYRLVSETGPDHRKTFTVEVIFNKKTLGTNTGKSKKIAEK